MVFTVTIQQIEDFQTICVNCMTHFLGPDLQLFEVQIKAKAEKSIKNSVSLVSLDLVSYDIPECGATVLSSVLFSLSRGRCAA